MQLVVQGVAGAEQGQEEAHAPGLVWYQPIPGTHCHWHGPWHSGPGVVVVVVQPGPGVVVVPVQLGGLWFVPNAPQAVWVQAEVVSGQKVGAKQEQPVSQVEEERDQVPEE